MPASLLAVLEDWLSPRSAHVVVNGAQSRVVRMCDMIYQGTVLGPPLWNIYYADAQDPIEDSGFQEIVFADDLNAFRLVDAGLTDDEVLILMSVCQQKLHSWGEANGVCFDSSKESMHIMSASRPFGENFKLRRVVPIVNYSCRKRPKHVLARQAGVRRHFFTRGDTILCAR